MKDPQSQWMQYPCLVDNYVSTKSNPNTFFPTNGTDYTDKKYVLYKILVERLMGKRKLEMI